MTNYQSNFCRRVVALMLTLVVGAGLFGCASNPDGKASLGTLNGSMFSMKDGAELSFQIERSSGTGGMWATNLKTGEMFKGQYTGRYNDGGSSFATVRGSTGATGTVTVFTPPTSANARGFLRGDKGTVIDIYLDITPGIVPRGTGEGMDNSGIRYRVQF